MSVVISENATSDTGVFKLIFKALKFIIISYILSVILLAILALVIVYTDVPESVAPVSIKGITLFGVFVSAFMASKTTGAKGWLCGAITGGLNVVLLQLIGSAISGTPVLSAMDFAMIASGVICGIIGGIIGVNVGHN